MIHSRKNAIHPVCLRKLLNGEQEKKKPTETN